MRRPQFRIRLWILMVVVAVPAVCLAITIRYQRLAGRREFYIQQTRLAGESGRLAVDPTGRALCLATLDGDGEVAHELAPADTPGCKSCVAAWP